MAYHSIELRKTDIESAGWKHDINQAIEDNNDKKSNVIRGFMGLSVTILGMLFAALWFTIQDQDQKAIMQMMIAINKSDAEQTLKVDNRGCCFLHELTDAIFRK
jgi:hypothetical protein